jgi:hypothetical protein
MKSKAAFSVAARPAENSFLGSPHHKHEVLATVVGLPHAEQTLARRIEVFSLGLGCSRNAISAEMFR